MINRFVILSFAFINLLLGGTLEEITEGGIQPPLFRAGEITYASSDLLLQTLQPILEDHLEEINYDRLSASLQIMNHFNSCSSFLMNELRNFNYIPIIDKGGPCVSISLDLIKRLPNWIKAYLVGAQLPAKYQQFAFPLYCHTAVMIRYQNPDESNDSGYIILDPSFDLPIPILINHETVFKYTRPGRDHWTMWLKDNQIMCQLAPFNELKNYVADDYLMIYRTDSFVNPIQASAIPMLIADRRLSLLSRDRTGKHFCSISVELDRNRVVWSIDQVQQPPIFFTDFLNGKTLPRSVSKALCLKTEELNGKIKQAIELKPILDRVFFEYLNFIEKYHDHSITGKLNSHPE